MITRRDLLRQASAIVLAIQFFPETLYARQKSLRDQIKENLSKLETIAEEQAGSDYHDPNNAANPLYIIKNKEFLLAPNFKLREFSVSGGKILPYARIDEDLIVALQQLRSHLNQPVFISSSYRTISRNKAVGGSPKSRHLSGDAADVYVKNLSPAKLMAIIESHIGEGIGLHAYDNTCHIHLDMRGYKSRW
jgi:uncharacterized protein YcbK (DUF882 family)